MKLNWTSAASQPGMVGSPPPPSAESPSAGSSTALSTLYGRTDTRNPEPAQAQKTTSHAGIRIPHGRTRARPSVIPMPAIPMVTVLRSTHPARPKPSPPGSSPSNEPTTQDTLISKYGASARAAP
ncbi:hypothetical protein ACTWQF_32450 [Streptomyces sp. 8N114]|uniref:hypothetical protein n=1 Tax=Streptomyces sp. 8N114 TaxID=3457419 RepID=UPI003FD376F2